MTGKRLAAESGAPDLIVVSYPGTAAIGQDLIAANLDFAVTGITAALPHHRAGSPRIVATQAPGARRRRLRFLQPLKSARPSTTQ